MFGKYKGIILSCAVMIALTVLLFWQFFLKGNIPIPTSYMLSWYQPWKSVYTADGVSLLSHKPVVDDAFRHLYPLRVIASDMIKKGQLPLWNPYNGSGTPLLAIMHPGYLTPFGIFFLFLSPTIAWTFYIMLQPLVLGISTYWYGKTLKLSERASLFSAFVLVLSGFAIVRLEYGEFLYVLTGLPLLLGIVERKKANSHDKSIIGIPFLVFFMMISGQPHMIVYTLLVFAAYTILRLGFFNALYLGGLSVVGIGMSAIQLLPSLELYKLSTINQETSTFIFDRFLLPISHLLTIVIPNYFGNQATYNYFGPHDYTETIAYVGSIPVSLALLAWWKYKRHPVVKFFVFVAIIATLSTIQWVGARVLFSLPIPVLSSDVPSRVFVLTTFSIAILSGFGFAIWEKLTPKELRLFAGIAIASMGVIGIATTLFYLLHVPCPTVHIPQCRLVSVRTSSIEILVLFIFLVASIWIPRAKTNLYTARLWLPLMIIIGIGLYNAGKFLPFSPKDTVFSNVDVITALQKVSGLDRYFSIGEGEMRTNVTSIFGLYSPLYFDPLHIRRYSELVSFANTADKRLGVTRSDILLVSDASPNAEVAVRRERFMDLTSTRYLVGKKEELAQGTGSQVVWEGDSWRILTRASSLPRMYMVYKKEVIPDDDHILSRLFDPQFDIANTVIVEIDAQESVTLSKLPESSTISNIRYTGNRIEANVTTSHAGFLVLTDTWYPGWKAFVDGKETPIMRANYTFRAILVPRGSHTVRFSYEPQSVVIGATLSLISLFFVCLFGLALRYGKIKL